MAGRVGDSILVTSLLIGDALIDVPEHCGEDMRPLYDARPVELLLKHAERLEVVSAGLFRCEICGKNEAVSASEPVFYSYDDPKIPIG